MRIEDIGLNTSTATLNVDYEASNKQNKFEAIIDKVRNNDKAPYSYLADNGVISYKGATYVCDYNNNSICLGDMSNKQNVLSIPLSGGGVLMVNRRDIPSLMKAIDMFSPKDVDRIVKAIMIDKKSQELNNEVEDLESSIGEISTANV